LEKNSAFLMVLLPALYAPPELPVSSCRCDPGWEGENCEKCVRMPGCVYGTCHQPWQCICDGDMHICEREPPCQNGAECVYKGDGEYSCLCPEGFHGKDCERKTGPCEKDENGFAKNFTCRCLAGFVGTLCESDVDDCLMRPCANGATCHDGINRFSCQCQVGFEGRFCTINIDDCASQPCKNGAKCYDRINNFDCLCPDGFTGKTCEVSAPEPTCTKSLWCILVCDSVGRGFPQGSESVFGNRALKQGVTSLSWI
uniref:Delta like non-canonical Notch ligand 2 n=1 Tax=Pelusios castaneus TaxID=367368 RepID=A0A8C8VF98_9SAUR